jgi:hypothetical protein
MLDHEKSGNHMNGLPADEHGGGGDEVETDRVPPPKHRFPGRYSGFTTALILGACLAAGLAIRLRGIDTPLTRTRDTQTASITVNLERDGVRGLLYPRVNYPGNHSGHLAFEFPLLNAFQVITARVFPSAGEAALKFPSLLSYLILAVSIFDLAGRWSDQRTAFFAIALFTIFPLSITMSVAPTPDMTAVSLSMLAMAALDRYLSSDRWSTLLVSATAFSAALLVKAPMLIVVLPCGALIYCAQGWKGLWNRRVIILLLLALLPLTAWMIHSHSVNANSQLTESRTAADLITNYMQQRGRVGLYTDPGWYLHLWSKLVDGYSRPGLAAAFLGLLVGLAIRTRFRVVLVAWFAALVFFVGVFPFHLATHEYYSLPVAPLAAITGGLFLSWMTTRTSRKASAVGWVIACGWCGFIATTIPKSMKYNATYGHCHVIFGEVAQALTAEDDLLVVAAPGLAVWDGTLLYRSSRRGWKLSLPTEPASWITDWIQKNDRSDRTVVSDQLLIDYLEYTRSQGATMIGILGRERRPMMVPPGFLRHLQQNYSEAVSLQCCAFFDLSNNIGRRHSVEEQTDLPK